MQKSKLHDVKKRQTYRRGIYLALYDSFIIVHVAISTFSSASTQNPITLFPQFPSAASYIICF